MALSETSTVCNTASTIAQVCTFKSNTAGNTSTATREMSGWVRKSKMGWWGQTGVRPMLGLSNLHYNLRSGKTTALSYW